MESSGVLQTTQFACRKGLGTCDVLLCVSNSLQSAFESGQEARIVQIGFIADFERVNHQGILYKLCSVGIGGSVLSILTQFYQIDHSTLSWTIVGVNWLMSYKGAAGKCFGPVIVPLIHLGPFFRSGE